MVVDAQQRRAIGVATAGSGFRSEKMAKLRQLTEDTVNTPPCSTPTYRGRTLAAYRPPGTLATDALIGALAMTRQSRCRARGNGAAERTNRFAPDTRGSIMYLEMR